MNDEAVTVYLPPAIRDKLRRLAQGVDDSAYIRMLIDSQQEPGGRVEGEFVSGGLEHNCPQCGSPTMYQVFSGGKEWYCENCEADGSYPDGRAPSRAGLLATAEGRAALRGQMRTHLEGLRDCGDSQE